MPILSMSAGRVTAIWGSAYYRQQDGSLKPVRVGDDLIGGQQILTDQDGIVEIEPAVLSPKLLKLIQAANDLDHTLKAVDARDGELVPAAGLDASGSGSLIPGIRVERIAEGLTPTGFDAALPSSMPVGQQVPTAATAWPTMTSSASDPSQGTAVTPPSDGDATLPPGEHSIPLLTLTVSEAGLSGHAPAGTAVQTTQLDLARSPAVAGLKLVPPSVPLLTESGQPVVWLSDGHGGLLAKASNDPAAPNILTAGLDAATGHITVSLLAPVQHPGAGSDTLTLDLGVRSSDPTAADVAVVHVSIQDDVPVAGAEATVSAMTPATNLMIMLDVSADLSQLQGHGVSGGPTPLQAMVQAAEQLMDHYAQAGQVAVRLVTFNDQARTVGDQWVSVSEAKTWLANLFPHGGLRYDVALPVAEHAFMTEAGRLPDAQNVSYLFAGGLPPAVAQVQGDLGLVDANEEKAWSQFLADHHIVSHAVGQGPWAEQGNLDPVAYDGRTLINEDAVVVDSLTDWHPMPIDLASFAAKGSLLDGVSTGADGFGRVQSLVVDGHTYLVDPSAPDMSIHTALGGTLTVNGLTGQYSYVAPSHFTGSATEAITYTVADKDGDTASTVLHAVINAPQALDLRDVLHSEPAASELTPAHQAGQGAHVLSSDQSLMALALPTAAMISLSQQGLMHVDA